MTRRALRRGAAWLVAATLASLTLGTTAHAQCQETTPSAATPAAGDPPGLEPVRQVNLNTASAAELQRLPGVGPSRAEAIIRQRERRPFRRVSEIMRIRGIGRRTYRTLRPMLTLEGPTTL